jgi:hypothetical protein
METKSRIFSVVTTQHQPSADKKNQEEEKGLNRIIANQL